MSTTLFSLFVGRLCLQNTPGNLNIVTSFLVWEQKTNKILFNWHWKLRKINLEIKNKTTTVLFTCTFQKQKQRHI